jgi:DNA-directed RNA polymerase specialized sigma subunit
VNCFIKPEKDYTKEDIAHMGNQVLAGVREPSLLHKIIDSHIPMAKGVAGFYARKMPYRLSDIYAAAYYGLSQGANRMFTENVMTDANITPYLYVRTRGAILDFCSVDSLIPIPRGEFKQRMEIEDARDFVTRTNQTESKNVMHYDVHLGGVCENLAVIIPIDTAEAQNAVDIPTYDEAPNSMEELYFKLRLNDTEIEVVSMRMEGYTISEIGKHVNLTKMRISQIVDEIKLKLPRIGLKSHLMMPKIAGTKVCNACGLEKSLSDFYKIGEDKYKSHCKHCIKEKHEEAVNNN